MKRKTTAKDIASGEEDLKRITKHSKGHYSSISTWESDAKHAMRVVSDHKTAMKSYEKTMSAHVKLLKKLAPKLDEAEAELKEAEKSKDKKRIKLAERQLKRIDDAAHNHLLEIAGAHGGYWGRVPGMTFATESLTLKLKSPF